MIDASASPAPETRPPASPDELFSALTALGIEFVNQHHAPVMTVQDNRALRGTIDGLHSKNLFLKDKSATLWLIVAEEQQSIDLKALGRHLGAGKFSFANADLLWTVLGVTPGSVTPFAVINDHERRVRVVLDQSLATASQANFHPLDNTQTTSVSGAGLIAFLQASSHAPLLVDFTKLSSPAVS